MSAIQRLASRRRVLRGMMGGAAISVGLPFLDGFLDTNGMALATTGARLPAVYSTWYFGLGCNPGRWEPRGPGRIGELGPETKPLERFRDKINLYTGMKVYLDGRAPITHFTGNMAMLTGTTPRSNAVTLATIDTVIADQIGAKTRFKSLEMASTGHPNHIYSFRPGGVLQTAEMSPVALYARLFGPGFKDPNAAEFVPDPQVMARQSVLSAVNAERHDLERMLGEADRARLDEYYTSLRQLEQQLALELQRPPPLEACSIPKRPAEEPTGTEVDMVAGNHRLFAQLAAYAFACDQTHAVNLTFSDMTSELRRAGGKTIHHSYTHEEPVDPTLGAQPNVAYFITRSMEGLADYLAALAGVREGAGTLLDRALVMTATDTGYARIHSLENIPVITAGGAAGRMKTGLHVMGNGDPITRVGLTVQQALGLPLNAWGTESMETSKTITEVLA